MSVSIVDTKAIHALGEIIEREVGAELDIAAAKLGETRGIEHANFTTVVPSLAVAYVGAVEFMEEQIKSKREHLGEIRTRLKQTADNWDAADQKSIIRCG